VIASALTPGKNTGAALPPEASQSFACLCVSILAAICIVLSYQEMNQWSTWIGAALVCGFGLFGYPLWKDEALEWLEPIFVIRSDSHKRLPNHQRQMTRAVSWLLGVLCAITGLWDIILHPPMAPLPNVDDPLAAVVSDNLILRWKPSAAVRDANETLATIASAMNLPVESLEVEAELPEHRLIIFHAAPGKLKQVTLSELRLNWSKLAHDPNSRSTLADLVDSSFPALISARTCNTVVRRDRGETVEDDSDKKGSLKTEDAREAYKAACKWWSDSIETWNSLMKDQVAEMRASQFKLLAQWQPGTNPTDADLQLSLANLMNKSSDTLKIETTFAAERVAIFKPADDAAKSKLGLAQAWRDVLTDPKNYPGITEKSLEHKFPGIMHLKDCRKMLAETEEATVTAEEEDAKLKREQKLVVRVACKWWTDQISVEERKVAKTDGEEKTTA